MRVIGLQRGQLHDIFRWSLIVVLTVLLGFIACLLGLLDRSGEAVIALARFWSRRMLAICGVELSVVGAEEVNRDQPIIFMSNHQSIIDILALVATIPTSFRFVAKRELAKIPFFGWAMAVGGHVFIDRFHHERALDSMRVAGERIRQGTNVILFPEGTRSPSGVLASFKKGGFHLAIEAQVPIVPVSVSGSRNVLRKKSRRIHPGPTSIVYGPPIETAGLKDEDRDALMADVRAGILAGMDEELQRDRR